MTIYLQPEVRSGLGEKTFWVWAEEAFPDVSYTPPRTLDPGDHLLQYSTRGAPTSRGGDKVGLLWELHPEMERRLGTQYPSVISRIMQCAAGCDRCVVSSKYMIQFYESFRGKIDVLPIGVDTDLFRPRTKDEVADLREKYQLPAKKTIGFWCGTNHAMKGFDLIKHNIAEHYLIVWKTQREAAPIDLPSATVFSQVRQEMLSELMACCDFNISTSRLMPYFMVDWEAMAVNLPFIMLGSPREFPLPDTPRDVVLGMGWAREQARKTWLEYLGVDAADV